MSTNIRTISLCIFGGIGFCAVLVKIPFLQSTQKKRSPVVHKRPKRLLHCCDSVHVMLQVVETEANREALRKELANAQRKYAELEDEVRVREKDVTMALEDARRSEHKLHDDRRNLEIVLENANADIQVRAGCILLVSRSVGCQWARVKLQKCVESDVVQQTGQGLKFLPHIKTMGVMLVCRSLN